MRAREGTLRVGALRRRPEEALSRSCARAHRTRRASTTRSSSCVLAGRDAARKPMLMMIPEAWENRDDMDPELRAFYEYHSCLMEPWDGPASIALHRRPQDRRRARPQRPAALALRRHQGRPRRDGLRGRRARHRRRRTCSRKERLQPGRIFFVDLEQGRIVEDEEIKAALRRRAALPRVGRTRTGVEPRRSAARRRRSGRAREPRAALPAPAGLRLHERGPAAPARADGDARARGRSARWATDAALACLSDRPQLLYHYFKQLFAQVTNPAIDSIHERPVMALYSTLGAERQPARGDAGARAA